MAAFFQLVPSRSEAVRFPRGRALLPRTALVVACLAGAVGCATVASAPPAPPTAPVTTGWSETGIASWYGEPFHGRRTASGETYDMEAPTAAHQTLPFGTVVRVENLENGRSTTLTINDRGPFVAGRIIDVSRRGARELGLLGPGIARVRIVVIDAPLPESCWEVQAGAFADEANARALRDRLRGSWPSVRIARGSDGLHRVRIGPFTDRIEAERAARETRGFLLGCGVEV